MTKTITITLEDDVYDAFLQGTYDLAKTEAEMGQLVGQILSVLPFMAGFMSAEAAQNDAAFADAVPWIKRVAKGHFSAPSVLHLHGD